MSQSREDAVLAVHGVLKLSCDHGWIRSGSVNVRKQQQQQQHGFVLYFFLPVKGGGASYRGV